MSVGGKDSYSLGRVKCMRRTEEKIYEFILHEQQRSPGASQNHSFALTLSSPCFSNEAGDCFGPIAACESLARVMTKFNQLSNSIPIHWL